MKQMHLRAYVAMAATIVGTFIGCDRRQEVAVEARSIACEKILVSINELPRRFRCNKWRDSEGFVYSNICHEVRALLNAREKVICINAYTNMISSLAQELETDENGLDLRQRLVMAENYRVFVHWGFALMDEYYPASPCTWDFLLRPICWMHDEASRIRGMLTANVTDDQQAERRAYLRKLNDYVSESEFYINTVWSPEAKRKMPSEQFSEVRIKVAAALGKLPTGMDGNSSARRPSKNNNEAR